MLSDITIKNLAIIDELGLVLAPGFNVLTGETGAGKSIIIDAVSLLLGGRADGTLIRSGCDAAIVEGTFVLASELQAELHALLEQEGLDEPAQPERLVLARELRANGRNVCRVNGRSVALAMLREIGARLIDIHGQSEHLSLLQVRSHLQLLDRFGGLSAERSALAAVVRKLEGARRELAELIEGARQAAQRSDLLNFQVKEIAAARLKPGEDAGLLEERTRLANAERLAELATLAAQAASEGAEGEAGQKSSAADLLRTAVQAMERLARIDPNCAAQLEVGRSLAEQAAEWGRDVCAYRDGIEFNPKRLQQVEERLHLLQDLQRKYGASIEAVLAHEITAAAELLRISNTDERVAQLRAQESELLVQIGALGSALSAKRSAAGKRLSALVMAELNDLQMSGGKFAAAMQMTDDVHGAPIDGGRCVAFDQTGIDAVEFMISPNPGEPLKPLVKIASGGETARLMLALKGVLAQADQTPTLIFDEIDQGLGGRVGHVVGQKLWQLAAAHQVLCITHLPQLAGFGDAHFRVEKQVRGRRTVTSAATLPAAARLVELAEMLGGDSAANRQSAAELLELVAVSKQGTKARKPR